MAKAQFERTPTGQDLPNGRRLVEEPMPKSFVGEHKLNSEVMTPESARRVKVYDSNVTEKRIIPGMNRYPIYPKDSEGYRDYDATPKGRHMQKGTMTKSDRGEKGLVGYTDIYREPEQATVSRDESGKSTGINFFNRTHVGYTNVPDALRGGGVGNQMLDYVKNTTHSSYDYPVNLGSVAHKSVQNWMDRQNAEKPDSVYGYKHRWM